MRLEWSASISSLDNRVPVFKPMVVYAFFADCPCFTVYWFGPWHWLFLRIVDVVCSSVFLCDWLWKAVSTNSDLEFWWHHLTIVPDKTARIWEEKCWIERKFTHLRKQCQIWNGEHLKDLKTHHQKDALFRSCMALGSAEHCGIMEECRKHHAFFTTGLGLTLTTSLERLSYSIMSCSLS